MKFIITKMPVARVHEPVVRITATVDGGGRLCMYAATGNTQMCMMIIETDGRVSLANNEDLHIVGLRRGV